MKKSENLPHQKNILYTLNLVILYRHIQNLQRKSLSPPIPFPVSNKKTLGPKNTGVRLKYVSSKNNSNLSGLSKKQITLKTQTAGNIATNVWTNIINFQLPAGKYLVMWQCKIDALSNNGDIIWGTRIRFGENDYPELRKYVSDQDNSMSTFSWVDISDTTTLNIEFYQNTGYEAYVSFRRAFILPIS